MKVNLDEHERSEFKRWSESHLAEKHNGIEPYGGAIGGRVSIIVTYTSIGCLVSAKCNACRDETFLLTNAGSL